MDKRVQLSATQAVTSQMAQLVEQKEQVAKRTTNGTYLPKASRIRALRHAKEEKQETVAARTGISRRTLAKMEKGGHRHRQQLFQQLAEHYDVEWTSLVFEDLDGNPVELKFGDVLVKLMVRADIPDVSKKSQNEIREWLEVNHRETISALLAFTGELIGKPPTVVSIDIGSIILSLIETRQDGRKIAHAFQRNELVPFNVFEVTVEPVRMELITRRVLLGTLCSLLILAVSMFAYAIHKPQDEVIAGGLFVLSDWEQQLIAVSPKDAFRVTESPNGVNLSFTKVHPKGGGISVAKLQQRLKRPLRDFRLSVTFRPQLPRDANESGMQGIAVFDKEGDGVVVRLSQDRGNPADPRRKFVIFKFERHILSERSDPLGSKLVSDLKFFQRPMTLTIERVGGDIQVYAESGQAKLFLGSRTHPAMGSIEIMDVRVGGYRHATLNVDFHEYSLIVPAKKLGITSW